MGCAGLRQISNRGKVARRAASAMTSNGMNGIARAIHRPPGSATRASRRGAAHQGDVATATAPAEASTNADRRHPCTVVAGPGCLPDGSTLSTP